MVDGMLFQAGNDYEEEFHDLKYVMKSVMIIKLQVDDPKVVFDPSLRDCRDIILQCFAEIIRSAEKLPRVSLLLHNPLNSSPKSVLTRCPTRQMTQPPVMSP